MHTASETLAHIDPASSTGDPKTSSPAICFQDVAVRYRIPREGVSGFKEFAIRSLQRRVQLNEFWALDGVSFEVMPGEVFGVIGRNGAGKSTLLKVMARVLHPTRGRLTLRGRVAPLLELGGGFHPELTGRENIFLNMALLGYSHQESETLFDAIVDFAEIPGFIDAPLRTYSTGMVARLGFSVATCMQPDILLVDEVLSVGDAPFQQKCMERMDQFQKNGTTIIIVTHSMTTVQTFCERALWLKDGKVKALGDVTDVVEQYIHDSLPQVAVQKQASRREALPYDFTSLNPAREIYPAANIFNPSSGSLSVWFKMNKLTPGIIAMLFHSDDSRFVLYVQLNLEEHTGQVVAQIIARAGGNRQALDIFRGKAAYPEISASIPARELHAERWNFAVMTWEGYPHGRLRLYVNGATAGEQDYDSRHNDMRPPPSLLALGMRPLNWSGELVEKEDGTIADLRPGSMMAVAEAGIDVCDIRLFQQPLSPEAVAGLFDAGPDGTT